MAETEQTIGQAGVATPKPEHYPLLTAYGQSEQMVRQKLIDPEYDPNRDSLLSQRFLAAVAGDLRRNLDPTGFMRPTTNSQNPK